MSEQTPQDEGIKETIQRKWDDLPPQMRVAAVIGGAFAVLAALVIFAGSGPDDDREQTQESEPVEYILTDDEEPGDRLEQIMAQISNVQEDVSDMSRDYERLSRDLERAQEGDLTVGLEETLDEFEKRLDRIEKRQEEGIPEEGAEARLEAERRGEDEDEEEEEEEEEAPETEERPEPEPEPAPEPEPEPEEDPDLWEPEADPEPAEPRQQEPGMEEDPEAEVEAEDVGIRTVEPEPTPEDEEEEEDDSIQIPAGSIITGTLITGMDAPTGRGARQQPHPALMRVQKEAILPNHFQADFRECFILLGGFGDLSSERAYLRGETISCVREDGGVIETGFDAYTVGEDGSAGLRGRLVSKQGQMLARSLTAGFMQGFSQAFGRQRIPQVRLDQDQPAFERMLTEDQVAEGVSRGASDALDRLSQFYLDQAQDIFPVIEISAGRQVEMVVVNGTQLRI